MIRRCHGASEEHVYVSLRLVFTCSVRRVRACCRGHLCGPHRNRLQIEGKLSLHPLRPNTHGANAHQIGSSGADVRVRRGAAVVLDERAGQWVARVAVTRVLTPIHTEARERHLCRNERQRGGMGRRPRPPTTPMVRQVGATQRRPGRGSSGSVYHGTTGIQYHRCSTTSWRHGAPPMSRARLRAAMRT